MMFKIQGVIPPVFFTLYYTKPEQIYFRMLYKIKRVTRNFLKYRYFKKSLPETSLSLQPFIKSPTEYKGNKTFSILNIEHRFENIDWNYKNFGKLWTYNLNYFNFLNQEKINPAEGIKLMKDFTDKVKNIKDGMEPYPTSLRGINWIKFLIINGIKNTHINDCLYGQYYILLKNLEYHLLGNHLLENALSLFFGSYYFKDEKLYAKAKKIIKKELERQVLSDGGHFEQSPMYHQLLLTRLLDCINMAQNNPGEELIELMREKASKMLGWIKNITFSNNLIPLFNDCAFKVAPDTSSILKYAHRLRIEPAIIELKDSGYRMIRKRNYEIAIDIADVKASYIPGHTHADTFTFELHAFKQPVVVDTGTSTYENNRRRQYERSTEAHNTVEIANENSSQVWSSFRVGRRARVKILKDTNDIVKAIHDGYYWKFKTLHKRTFILKENEITIKDEVTSDIPVISRIHLHPDIDIKTIEKNKVILSNGININFKNANVRVKTCKYAPQFNKLVPTKVLEMPFRRETECIMRI